MAGMKGVRVAKRPSKNAPAKRINPDKEPGVKTSRVNRGRVGKR